MLTVCFLLLLFFSSTVLNFSEQDSAIQLLVFMLPPCNSDTLQCLLSLLSTVSAHAEDSLDSEGHKVEAGFYSSLKCFREAQTFVWWILYKCEVAHNEVMII